MVTQRIQAEHADRSGELRAKSLACLDTRGLAGTIRSDDRSHGSPSSGERDSVNGTHRSVSDHEVVHVEREVV